MDNKKPASVAGLLKLQGTVGTGRDLSFVFVTGRSQRRIMGVRSTKGIGCI